MNPVIARLKELASLDGKLHTISDRRRAQEEAVAAAEAALAEAEGLVGDRHDEIKRLRKEADELNLEVRSAEAEVERLAGQLRMAKSNKEYEVLKREVDAAEEKKSGFEDGVLERLERVDVVLEGEAAARAAGDAARASLEAARGDLAALEEELAGDEAALTESREATVSGLDPETRHLYEALLVQRGDSALAKVKDGSCSACARKLSAQMEVLIDTGEEIVQCMSCRRILYLDDGEAGP